MITGTWQECIAKNHPLIAWTVPTCMQLVDIKIYLKSEDTLIAKTQIPISSVPLLSNSNGPSAVAAMQSEDATASGAATPRTTHDGMFKGLGGLDSLSLASHSMPSTPRGTGEGDCYRLLVFTAALAFAVACFNMAGCLDIMQHGCVACG